MARARASGSGSGVAGASRGSGLFQIARNPVPAVLAFRNRSITVMRGTAVNEFGDRTNVGTPLHTGIPAALAETKDVVFDAATQRQQEIRSITCVVPNWADIQDSDTLMDEATGSFYMVTGIQARPGIGYYPADKLLSLRERSGVTIASD
jgi:hypothetical protein